MGTHTDDVSLRFGMLLELRMSRNIEVSEEFELQVSGVENVAAELCTTGIVLVGTEHNFEPLQTPLEINRLFHFPLKVFYCKICKRVVLDDDL